MYVYGEDYFKFQYYIVNQVELFFALSLFTKWPYGPTQGHRYSVRSRLGSSDLNANKITVDEVDVQGRHKSIVEGICT